MLNDSTNVAGIEPRRTLTDTPNDWLHKKIVRSRMCVFSEVVDMTPEMAKVLLAGNEKNRNVNENHVKSLASDMKAGMWDLNGEPIIVSRDGRLNDGQHRLYACVASGASFPTVVTFGLDYDSRLTTNTGRAKKVGDFLAMEAGVKNSTNAASVARILLANRLGLNPRGGGTSVLTKVRNRQEYFDNAKDIDHALSIFTTLPASRTYGGASVLAAALVILKRAHPLAEEFLLQVVKGTNLSEGAPALYAREKLATDRKMPIDDRLVLLRKAFDAYLSDRPVTRIQVKVRKDAGKPGKKRAA